MTLFILSTNNNNNFDNNTTSSNLSYAVDNQFESTIYTDEQITEQHDYTNQEFENLRDKGNIQEALNQALALVTSDEGKRSRKKVWERKSTKWA